MRRVLPALSIAVFWMSAPTFGAGVTGYYRFPAIRGETVVFAAEGDLWQVSASGGSAMRLTTHEGNEGFPKFSPDGKWLAFSAQYDGNVDVYVMPAGGGEPLRLTYHPEADEVVAWRPDSESIVYRTQSASPNRDYNLCDVPRRGGQPRPVPVGIAALASFSADGRHIAFNPYSDEFRNWKRYLGGTAQDIWVGDLQAGTFAKVTDWAGTDTFPMWHAGRLYFASDRAGRMNLFAADADGRNVQQFTYHDEYDVRWPDMDAGRIVYMHGGDLWVFDLATGDDHVLDITLPSDRVWRRPRVEDAGRTIDSYDLNPSGKRLLVSSRGEMWVSPTKPGRIVQLTESSGVRERAAVYARDGKQVACITDETGEQEIALFDAAGKERHRILTQGGKGWLFDPVWSPDGTKLAYADLTQTLFIVEVEGGAVTRVDGSDVSEIREYAFSPDGKWLAYVKEEFNRYHSIYLYDVVERAIHAVSAGFSDDSEPTWDPKGKYLYFLSERHINPVMDVFDMQHICIRTTQPCVVVLARDGKSPFLPEELLEEPKKPKDQESELDREPNPSHDRKDAEDAAEGEAADEESEEEAAKPPRVVVDVAGIDQRVVEVPVPADRYFSLRAVADKLLYLSGPVEGLLDDNWPESDEKPKCKLWAYDFKKRKCEVLLDPIRDFGLSANGKRIAYRVKDEITVADLDSVKEQSEATKDEDEPKELVDPSNLPLRVHPAEEWAQIYAEAWRLQRDFYWAENMAGLDWGVLRQRYGRLLPRISTRQELNDLIGQLLGELGTSHTYVWGGDIHAAEHVGVGLLGADLAPNAPVNAYQFVRILRPEPWESDIKAPLTQSHARVQEGDYLFAINGRMIGLTDSVGERLTNLAGKQVLLTVGRAPDRSDARDVQVEALASEAELRYRDWCRRNREYVLEKTDGRIGYLHLPDMGGAGLAAFIRGFYPQINTDGLIVDIRYNGGGFVSQMIIERLARTVIGYDQPRHGAPETYPYRTHIGYKAVLINEQAGSDGDIFPAAFQLAKLGPVIGKRTWGGVVGIRGDKLFIDGGLSTQPEFAWWDRRRGWDLENHGVDPDIEVDMRPEDYVAGRDPQVDRAIEELNRLLDAQPVDRPAPPPIPDKSRPPATSRP